MAENQFFIDSDKLSEKALERKHRLEQDPSFRTDHMQYMEGMERIESDVMEKVLSQMNAYDYNSYTVDDVKRALASPRCSIENFKALLSPAAAPFLEEMAQKAKYETSKHFGNTVYIFTHCILQIIVRIIVYIADLTAINDIHRKKLNQEEIEKEMKVIADSGIEEILILTGESRQASDVHYIGEACKLAQKYFKNVGLEILSG